MAKKAKSDPRGKKTVAPKGATGRPAKGSKKPAKKTPGKAIQSHIKGTRDADAEVDKAIAKFITLDANYREVKKENDAATEIEKEKADKQESKVQELLKAKGFNKGYRCGDWEWFIKEGHDELKKKKIATKAATDGVTDSV